MLTIDWIDCPICAAPFGGCDHTDEQKAAALRGEPVQTSVLECAACEVRGDEYDIRQGPGGDWFCATCFEVISNRLSLYEVEARAVQRATFGEPDEGEQLPPLPDAIQEEDLMIVDVKDGAGQPAPLSVEDLSVAQIERLEKIVKKALDVKEGSGPFYRIAYTLLLCGVHPDLIERLLISAAKQARVGYVKAGVSRSAVPAVALPSGADELYYSVPLKLSSRLQPVIRATISKKSRARFWYYSQGDPTRCCIVFWPTLDAEPFPVYVPCQLVRISAMYVNPPAMPKWAREKGA